MLFSKKFDGGDGGSGGGDGGNKNNHRRCRHDNMQKLLEQEHKVEKEKKHFWQKKKLIHFDCQCL